MGERQKRRVESIKQRVQNIALNAHDRCKEKVPGNARTSTAIPEPTRMLLLGAGPVGLAGWGGKKRFKKYRRVNLSKPEAGSFGSAFFVPCFV